MLINIELKTSVIRYEGIEQETHNIVKNNKMEKYIIYSSFLPESVAMMKNIAPECESAMLAVSFEDCINKARQTKADALHPYVGGMNCEIPKDMQGMAVRGWNVDEPFYKDGRVLKDKNFDRFKAYGVTDIITNVPEIYLSRK
uniref:glycerophosphodiester phosphodiesterase family protein n=1 Tax=Lachnospira sp. TaxID=2049031 RepID=UPI004025E527